MNLTKIVLMSAGVLLLQACVSGTSPDSSYYRMNSLLDENRQNEPRLQEYDFRLGIGPVSIADYLDRPQIMSRSSTNKLNINEFERWSGTLQDNLEIVLLENLEALLGSEKVVGHPWPRAVKPDYHASLKVQRFDARDKNIVLRASWIILGKKDETLLSLKTVEITEPTQADDSESRVAAKSRALQKLSERLVTELGKIIQTGG